MRRARAIAGIATRNPCATSGGGSRGNGERGTAFQHNALDRCLGVMYTMIEESTAGAE